MDGRTAVPKDKKMEKKMAGKKVGAKVASKADAKVVMMATKQDDRTEQN